MPNHLPFFYFQDVYFEPDAIAAMSAAMDKACQSLEGASQPDIIKEIIAKGILDLARNGERDPDQLCDEALKVLGFN
jgi:hypothetical protein